MQNLFKKVFLTTLGAFCFLAPVTKLILGCFPSLNRDNFITAEGAPTSIFNFVELFFVLFLLLIAGQFMAMLCFTGIFGRQWQPSKKSVYGCLGVCAGLPLLYFIQCYNLENNLRMAGYHLYPYFPSWRSGCVELSAVGPDIYPEFSVAVGEICNGINGTDFTVNRVGRNRMGDQAYNNGRQECPTLNYLMDTKIMDTGHNYDFREVDIGFKDKIGNTQTAGCVVLFYQNQNDVWQHRIWVQTTNSISGVLIL